MKRYERAFKENAVKLSYKRGKGQIASLERELGITPSCLYKWRQDYEKFGAGSFCGPGYLKLTPEQATIANLKKKINDSEVTLEILKKGTRSVSQGKIATKQFIEDNKSKFSISKICAVLEVSRTTYYRRKKQELSDTESRIILLKQEIVSIFNEFKQEYGCMKITKELHKRGFKIQSSQVTLYMKMLGIRYKPKRKFVPTTDSTHNNYIVPNALNRQFTVDGPARAWVSDVKKITYDYDLISGNVKRVTYQPGKKDQYIHKYEYDADNRITAVYTSKDDVIWEKEANYLYYDHGPLARVELGDKKVQGIDYIYTLQGWLKSVNGEKIDRSTDPGRDGLVVPRDAFAFALNYYSGDYTSRYGQNDPTIDNNLMYYSRANAQEGNTNLYNGNIKEMITSLTDETQKHVPTQFNKYSYDQLNRITGMKSTATYYDNLGTPILNKGSYESGYSYDRNGNLKTMTRRGLEPNETDGTLNTKAMDQFSYRYLADTNKLTHIDDAIASNNFNVDIDDQYLYNYEYDATGQLITDYTEGLKIEWRVDGKVKNVIKGDTTISFSYDGLGNRIAKTVTKGTDYTTTYYSRDAQGNVINIYEMVKEGTQDARYFLVARDIYGSSRLGQEECRVELTDEETEVQGPALRMLAQTQNSQPIEAMATPACPISGLSFTGNNSTTWTDATSQSLNLFINDFPQTRKFMMAAKIKINNEALPILGKRKVTDLQGEQTHWNERWKHFYSYRSTVSLLVEKDQQGRFVPIVQLEYYYRDSEVTKRSPWDTWHSIRQESYRFAPIASNEWDIRVMLRLSNTQKYIPSLVINDNEYKQYIEEPVLYRDNKKRSDHLPTFPPLSSIGQRSMGYFNHENMNMPAPLPALVMEMCDFRYFVEDPLLEKVFLFDNQSAASELLSDDDQEVPVVMGLNNVDFSCNYCGAGNIDTDKDGLYDAIDNCPKNFNPFQEDTDGDRVGDICDNCKYRNPLQEDDDKDNVGNGGLDTAGNYRICDNCRNTPNYEQTDTDDDKVGDVCDNCLSKANTDQADDDKDGIGDECEGDDQGEGPALVEGVETEAERYVRLVGDKRYELSNHLGNVLEVITDRKLIGGNSLLINYKTNTFASETEGWTALGATSSAIPENGMLKVTASENAYGANLNLDNLTVGTKYKVSFDIIKPGNINFSYTVLYSNGTNQLQLVNALITSSGRVSFVMTPTVATLHRLRVRLTQANYTGPAQTVYIDNVKIDKITEENAIGYVPDVISYSDYDPFGMLMTGRHSNSTVYRYGFQGQEMDNELKGEGNSLNYTFRMHDPRVGRFFSIDPLFKEYPELTPYQFASNSPIDMIEIEGLEGGWIVNAQGKAAYATGPQANYFDNEQAARTAAARGVKTPQAAAAQEQAWLQAQARAPKVQKQVATLRSNNADDVMFANRDHFLGGKYAVGSEVMVEAMGEAAIAKALSGGYKVYKAYKQSRLATKAVQSAPKLNRAATEAVEYIDDGIRSVELPIKATTPKISKIDVGKQGKHIVGNNNYNTQIANGKSPSILEANAEDLLKSYNNGGTVNSTIINDVKTRVDFGTVIGKYFNPTTGKYVPTTNGIIHNSKTGAHIVPSAPNP